MVKKGAEKNKEVIGKNNSAWILKSEEKNSVFDTKNRDRMTNQNYRTNQKSLIMSSNTKRKIYSISLLSLSSDVSLLLLKISASLCCISLIIPSVYGKKKKSQILSWSFHTKNIDFITQALHNYKQYLSVFEGLLKEFLMMEEMWDIYTHYI